jgi:hypothetical protein
VYSVKRESFSAVDIYIYLFIYLKREREVNLQLKEDTLEIKYMESHLVSSQIECGIYIYG